MKKCSHICFLGVLLALGVAGTAAAQSTPGSALPPPDMHDPGVAPAASTATPRAAAVVPHTEAPPNVNIRRQGSDVIQEYSQGGRVYMIKVIPARGPEQTYMDVNGDGLLDLQPGQAPVDPVYFTLYEWGKPDTPPDARRNAGDTSSGSGESVREAED